MIIVLEGPDGGGKSTMIEAIKQVHLAQGHAEETVQIWRAGPFPQDSNAWAEYVVPIGSLYASPDWLVLMDRWHVGELVYGPLLRGGSRLSMEQREWIEGCMKTMGAFLVYITATPDELVKRVGVRGDDLIKTEQLAQIHAGYEALIADGHQPRLFARRYDTTEQRTEPTATAIYEASKMETAIAISEHQYRTTDHRPYWEQHQWPS